MCTRTPPGAAQRIHYHAYYETHLPNKYSRRESHHKALIEETGDHEGLPGHHGEEGDQVAGPEAEALDEVPGEEAEDEVGQRVDGEQPGVVEGRDLEEGQELRLEGVQAVQQVLTKDKY